jgi:hypothetical protein
MGGKRYAVLVGNGCFPDAAGAARLPTLRCPAADVADLADLLQAAPHGGYAVTTLVDRPHGEIRRALYDRLKQAGPDDQVLAFYSGHGKLDENGNLYLAGSDTDPDSLDPTALAAADLQKYVSDSRAGARIVILDCCFSGAVERIFRHGASKGDVAEQAGQALRAQAGQGVFYLTASTDTQTAEEKDQDRHSLLTKHIIAGISRGAADADDDGAVRFSELCGYVQGAIRNEGAQRPLSFALQAYGDPVVALTGRPALAERREQIEQQVYALCGKRLLHGPDAARILDAIHRPGADPATIAALHDACGDDAAFLRAVHRLPDLPDVAAEPPKAAATPRAAAPDRAPEPDPAAPRRAPEPDSAASRRAPEPEAAASRRAPEPNSAVSRRAPPWQGAPMAGQWFGRRAAILGLAVAMSLALGAWWVFRPGDPAAAPSAQTGSPTAGLALLPYPAAREAGNQANPAAANQASANQASGAADPGGTNLVRRSVPLVKGGTPLLVTPYK